jgi:hypothetical protein
MNKFPGNFQEGGKRGSCFCMLPTTNYTGKKEPQLEKWTKRRLFRAKGANVHRCTLAQTAAGVSVAITTTYAIVQYGQSG